MDIKSVPNAIDGYCTFCALLRADCLPIKCERQSRSDGQDVIFITEEDLLKLKMRGEL